MIISFNFLTLSLLVCFMYKRYILQSSKILYSLKQKSHKYEWAAEQHQQVSANRETFTLAIFAKLTALDPSNYYENLFKDKVDSQLSALINCL